MKISIKTKSIAVTLILVFLCFDVYSADSIQKKSIKKGNEIISSINKQRDQKFLEHLDGSELSDAVDLSQNSRIVIFRSRNSILQILKEGILNIHQAQKSSGFYDPDSRSILEDIFAGQKLGHSAVANYVRPKSGIVVHPICSDFINPGLFYGNKDDNGGGIGLVLKQKLMSRTLWSFVDSLELLETKNQQLWPKTFNVPYLPSVFPQIGNSPRNQDSPLTFQKGPKKILNKASRYIESLTFGAIEPSDIDFIIAPAQSAQDLIEKIKSFGFEVKFYSGYKIQSLLKPLGLSSEVLPIKILDKKNILTEYSKSN